MSHTMPSHEVTARSLTSTQWSLLVGPVAQAWTQGDVEAMLLLMREPALVSQWRLRDDGLRPVLSDEGRAFFQYLRRYAGDLRVADLEGLRRLQDGDILTKDKSAYHRLRRAGLATHHAVGDGRTRYVIEPFGRALLVVFESKVAA